LVCLSVYKGFAFLYNRKGPKDTKTGFFNREVTTQKKHKQHPNNTLKKTA
jgi:hypothetical protein